MQYMKGLPHFEVDKSNLDPTSRGPKQKLA